MAAEPWTYVIRPFFGTFLAFFLARLYDAHKRYLDRISAANFALITLKNQYNDFLTFRSSFHAEYTRERLDGTEPVWALLRPGHMKYGDYDFDFDKVSFLFERGGRPAAFDDIEEVQIKHRDLVGVDEHRTNTAKETQRLAAKEGKVSAEFHEVAQVLGKAYVAELEFLAEHLAFRATLNEEAYLKAFESLRTALREYFMETWRYRLDYLWRMRHDATIEDKLLKLRDRLKPGFNKDELPPFPKNLQERVDNLVAQKKAMDAKAREQR